MIRIGENFSYRSKLKAASQNTKEAAVAIYKEHIDAARQLEDDFVIFLDTNVLLGYYHTPIVVRKKFYQFLKKNKERIFICDQVNREFERHYKQVNKAYKRQLKLESPTAYQKELPGLVKRFLSENDDVLGAYPDFRQELNAVLKNSYRILEKLKDLGEERVQNCKKILEKENLVELLPELLLLDKISKNEFKFLKQEFLKLKESILENQEGSLEDIIDYYLYKHPSKVFPGIGDIKKKPQKPYGDYCIYHEMMKWLHENPQDLPIIFLTNDVTKSDWVNSSKQAYVHYIENFYLNTNQILYVLHAEEIFTSLWGKEAGQLVDLEAIWEDTETALFESLAAKPSQTLSQESIKELLNDLYPNRNRVEEGEDYWEELIADLIEHYNIKSVYQLRIDLLEHYHLLVQSELGRFRIYDQLDALEVTLELIYE